MNTSSLVFVSAAVEGKTDEPVVRKLVDHAGARIHRIHVKRGKDRLKKDRNIHAAIHDALRLCKEF